MVYVTRSVLKRRGVAHGGGREDSRTPCGARNPGRRKIRKRNNAPQVFGPMLSPLKAVNVTVFIQPVLLNLVLLTRLKPLKERICF